MLEVVVLGGVEVGGWRAFDAVARLGVNEDNRVALVGEATCDCKAKKSYPLR
jgi:hypothetical protein